ncbi:hypothetical protein ACFLT1_10130, partial [Bacteroidota bacterium]
MKRQLLFTAVLLVQHVLLAQLIPITEIQGTSAASPYVDETVTTKGAVTGVYKDGYFIRESALQRAGIYVYDPGRDPMPRLGDTIQLTGLVTEYYEWTEIKSLTEYEVLSTGNPEPEPVVLMADEIDEGWESCLVRLEYAICTNTNLGYGEWELEDPSGKVVVNDLGVSYAPELDQEYLITGPVSYSFGAYKIEPRTLDDIIILAPVYFTISPKATEITQTSLTLSWETNAESSTNIEWGYTKDLEMGFLGNASLTRHHTLSINNLTPATMIYARAFSEIGQDTASGNIQTYITASESSGRISVFFNRTITDPTFIDSTGLFTLSLADTLVK